jgi:hypothetical protein
MADAIDCMLSAFSLPGLIDEIQAGPAGPAGPLPRNQHAAGNTDGSGVAPPQKRQAGPAGPKLPNLAVQTPAATIDRQFLTLTARQQPYPAAGPSHENGVAPLMEAGPAGPALAECLSRLQSMPYPADIEIDRWALFLGDAADFVAVWGPQAARTGWRASDLFAVPGGLCWALEGREVVALSITPSEATIRAKDAGAGPGATAAFHRSAALLALPWELKP